MMAATPSCSAAALSLLVLLCCCCGASYVQAEQLPPRVSTPESEVRVKEGQTGVVLECTLDVGDDPIQYRWLKNHVWVTGSLGHAYRGYKRLLLALQTVRRDHAGQYVCEAKNEAGIHTVTITVVVESDADAVSAAPAPMPKTNEMLAELAASLSDVLAESDCQCDLLFLLHASPDAPPDLVSVQANLIHTITENIISHRVRVSLMTYSDYIEVKLPFNNGTNTCALRKAFDHLEHKMWSTKMSFVLREVFKRFKKSTSRCKVLFLPVVASVGTDGIDLLGAQNLKKMGVTIFLLEVTETAIPGITEMASQRGDGKPYHWRVAMPVWPSIVTYMQYISEELIGCEDVVEDEEGVCVSEGAACTQNEQCRGAGMGCLQGICQSLECNVDPTNPGCCAVPGRFWCGDVTRNCTSSQSFCDGRVHCMNGRDEDTCWSRPCPNDRVAQCESTTLCLSLSELCDDQYHCPGGEDEDVNFCKRFPCPSERPFRCRSGKCIATDKLCDGKFMDCDEGEDETLNYCYRIHRCSGDRSFKCDYGVCVENSAVCDGTYNCLDGTDEILCGRTACPVARPFKCSNGECIRMDTVCNGHPDGCSDGSDEQNCANFTCPAERSFKCSNGRCIDGWLQCNKGDDCGDGTDELDCPYLEEPSYRTSTSRPTPSQPGSTTYATTPQACRAGQFSCRSGACLPEERVCDGRSNCVDGDDEIGCSEWACPSERPHRCPGGSACVSATVCDGVADCPDGSDEQDCTIVEPDGSTHAGEDNTLFGKPREDAATHHDSDHHTEVDEELNPEDDDDLTYDEYNYDDYSYDTMLTNNGIKPFPEYDDTYDDTPQPDPEPEVEPSPFPEVEPEVDLVHPDDPHGHHNSNGQRHGYDVNTRDGEDETMTMLEQDDEVSIAEARDRAQDSGSCLHIASLTSLLGALLTAWAAKVWTLN